ncbi:YceI family protein [Sulfurimonas sp. SAG-AH-194-C21]|nr:YceI family protein [Sulfurimonas sp. SAG-AH-194-C21]MDF1883082.1 YceI family protein [Sulfurimonas sp. SAG-AH-194-C21]
MKSLFTQLITLVLLAGALQAHEAYTVDAKKSSVYYKSLADVLFFIDTTIIGNNQSVSGQINVLDNKLLDGKILINIKGFDSENSMRDSDVMSLLGFDINPNITFAIYNTELIDSQLYLVGDLEVNSITKAIKMPVIKTFINDSITVSGKLDVMYADFGIEPPTVAGFIKKALPSVEIGATIRFVKTK